MPFVLTNEMSPFLPCNCPSCWELARRTLTPEQLARRHFLIDHHRLECRRRVIAERVRHRMAEASV